MGFHCVFCLKLAIVQRSLASTFYCPIITPYSASSRHVLIDVWLVMPIRLMCLLFSTDLTVTDSIPLCSLPTHSPQESEFQETASDRSDSRETEDGGLSGTENNRIFLLFSLHSLLHFQLFHAVVVGHRFWKWKKKKKVLAGAVLCWWKNNFDFYAERNIFVRRITLRVREWFGFTQLCLQCVNVSLWKNFCSITCLFMSDWGVCGSLHSDPEERTDILCVWLCACVCVFTHLARMSGRTWVLVVTLAMSLGAKRWEGWRATNG